MKTNTHFDRISLNYSYNETFSERKCRQNQNTEIAFSNVISKIVPFMR